MSGKQKVFLQMAVNWVVTLLLLWLTQKASLKSFDWVIVMASVFVSCGIGSAYRKSIGHKHSNW